METVETVEKVLLHTDTYELKQAQARAKQAEKDLNNFIKTVETELKRKLEPEEAMAVKDDALNWLESSLTFPLPNAPEKLKYSSIDVDIWAIKDSWKKRNWEKFEFAQEGNLFRLEEEQTAYRHYFKYATPRQLEVLEQTKSLCDALNVAAEQGLHISHTHAGAIVAPIFKLKDIFRVIRYNEKDGKFSPFMEAISGIR